MITSDSKYLEYDNPGRGDCGVFAFVIGIMEQLQAECAHIPVKLDSSASTTFINGHLDVCPVLKSMVDTLRVDGFNVRDRRRGNHTLADFIAGIRNFRFGDINVRRSATNQFLDLANIIFRKILVADYVKPINDLLANIDYKTVAELTQNGLINEAIFVLRHFLGMDIAQDLWFNDIFRHEASQQALLQFAREIRQRAAEGGANAIALIKNIAEINAGLDIKFTAINLPNSSPLRARLHKITQQSTTMQQNQSKLVSEKQALGQEINKKIVAYNVEAYVNQNEVDVIMRMLKILCGLSAEADQLDRQVVQPNSCMQDFFAGVATPGKWLTAVELTKIASNLNIELQLSVNGSQRNIGWLNDATATVHINNWGNRHWTTFVPIYSNMANQHIPIPADLRHYVGKYAEVSHLSVSEIRNVLEGYCNVWWASARRHHLSLAGYAITRCDEVLRECRTQNTDPALVVDLVMQFIFASMPAEGAYNSTGEFAARLSYLCFRHSGQSIEEARGTTLGIDSIRVELNKYYVPWWSPRRWFRHHMSLTADVLDMCNTNRSVPDIMRFLVTSIPANYNHNGKFAATIAPLCRRCYGTDDIGQIRHNISAPDVLMMPASMVDGTPHSTTVASYQSIPADKLQNEFIPTGTGPGSSK